MKKIIGIGIAVVVIAAIACVGFKLHSDAGYYYTQIDNSKAEQITSNGGVIDFNGGMSYSFLPITKRARKRTLNSEQKRN